MQMKKKMYMDVLVKSKIETCEISIPELISNFKTVWPLTHHLASSIHFCEKVQLEKGTNISTVWFEPVISISYYLFFPRLQILHMKCHQLHHNSLFGC